jgi:hypothetical protein
LKIKTNPEGSIEWYKAPLVVKEFIQREGINYNETFSPVCRYQTIRVMVSIAAAQKMNIIQFDISTAFLNSELKEAVFMAKPEGY